MLDTRLIVSHPEQIELSLKKRGADKLIPQIQHIISLNQNRAKLLQEVEALKHQKNQASIEIARLKKEGADTSQVMSEMKEKSQKIKELDEQVFSVEAKLNSQLYELPNILNDTVPAGRSSVENAVVKTVGEIPRFSFEIKSHDEIGEAMDILDFKKASVVTGARFVFLKGLASQLERALIQFMIETHRKKGYKELSPPFLVNEKSLTGTGQLPKFADDVFKIERYPFYLIPTAEVPITNYHSNEILKDDFLPQKYVAYSPCFRSEAGSYGKDTKGLKRQHQFDKVELVIFDKPENSLNRLDELVQDAEEILKRLELPYRVVLLCGGDTGFSSSKTFDLEVWMPALKSYVEISSCSLFTDFQARRSSIQFRDCITHKTRFVHTLNGSGLAVGRTLMAIMENFQNKQGTFEIPKVLIPYFEHS